MVIFDGSFQHGDVIGKSHEHVLTVDVLTCLIQGS